MMTRIITFLLLLVLSSIPLFGLCNAPYLLKSREFFLTLCYIAFTSLLWRSKLTRVFSILLIIFWVLNSSISIIIYQLFDNELNYQLAMTMLSTNLKESKDFLISYWPILLISLCLFVCLLYTVYKVSIVLSKRTLIILSSILILTVVYKFSESAFRGRLSDPTFNMPEKVLPYTSLNNLGVFSRAYQELNLLRTVASYRPDYVLDIQETQIDTYVIVIGESVRRDHVSLNGYSRKTTPNIDHQKDNLFIFEQAIAPAPITTMSLSTALTIKQANDYSPNLLSDNFLNYANQAGFETYWFSRQNAIGQFETIVTSIAKTAQHKEWLADGYDDALLAKLDEALSVKSHKKKLIVLHTNGSHLSACNQYPAEDQFFVDGQSEYEDCYDNSILFMDKLMQDIFDRLKNSHASVLYFSDHGQMKRIKRGEVDYIHGSINPTKESVDVPQFIWYSPVLSNQNKKVGIYNEQYPLADNYFLIANWLGIRKINGQTITSPLMGTYAPQNKIIIMDTRLNIFDYQELESDNGIN